MQTPQPGQDWTDEEVTLVVADYFDMLRTELLNQPYNKAEHNRNLRSLIPARSKAAVEKKHQNISAVLIALNLPYIHGYKPLSQFQGRLIDAVADYLNRQPGVLNAMESQTGLSATATPTIFAGALDNVFVEAPEPLDLKDHLKEVVRSRRGRWPNYVERDAQNRELGRLGEEFVVGVERRRLLKVGRDDLAARIEWVAQTQGDGLGFDVLSFDETDESERPIEVKTTGLGQYFPFYVTRNEVEFSRDRADTYHLYRVFDFRRSPKVYKVRGDLNTALRLEAMQYLANISA